MSLTKNTGGNIGKIIFKNLIGKYNIKLIHHPKQSGADPFKIASKWAIQISAKATGDLIGNKIADDITTVSETSPQNNSETVTK